MFNLTYKLLNSPMTFFSQDYVGRSKVSERGFQIFLSFAAHLHTSLSFHSVRKSNFTYYSNVSERRLPMSYYTATKHFHFQRI